MTGLDLDALAAPIGEDAACGPNLEYDQAFFDLDILATRRDEQQVGDSVLEAEEPDWKAVRRSALELLERSRDLRVVAQLAKAALNLEGLPGFSESLQLAARLLDEQWDGVHPQLDAEDDNDPTMRINVVGGFADPVEILPKLRHIPLVESRLGSFSLRDVRLALGEEQPHEGESPTSETTLAGAFADADAGAQVARAEAVIAALEATNSILSSFVSNLDAASTPDLDGLSKLLTEMLRAFERFGSAATAGAESDGTESDGPRAGPESSGNGFDASADPSGAAAGTAAPHRQGFSGAVQSRADVVRALDAICTYYATAEPGSPLPILLQRARRLVEADFLTIIQDVAPDGYTQAQAMLGVSETPADDGWGTAGEEE